MAPRDFSTRSSGMQGLGHRKKFLRRRRLKATNLPGPGEARYSFLTPFQFQVFTTDAKQPGELIRWEPRKCFTGEKETRNANSSKIGENTRSESERRTFISFFRT